FWSSIAQPSNWAMPSNGSLCPLGSSMLIRAGPLPSGLFTVNDLLAVPRCPVAEVAVTSSVWDPLPSAVVSRLNVQPTVGQSGLAGYDAQTSGRDAVCGAVPAGTPSTST